MGNGLKKDTDEDWRFTGRDRELERLLYLVKTTNKRLITITGLQKIGKSRLMLEVYNDTVSDQTSRCMYHDFQNDNPESTHFQLKWLKEIYGFFGGGNLGKLGDGLDFTTDNGMNCVVDAFSEQFQKSDTYTVLFLDNVETILGSALRNNFQKFVKTVLQQCLKLKLVMTSSEKLNCVHKRIFENVHVAKLNDESTLMLLREVYTYEEGGKPWEDVQEFMKYIARLCEGLPHAAIMAGIE